MAMHKSYVFSGIYESPVSSSFIILCAGDELVDFFYLSFYLCLRCNDFVSWCELIDISMIFSCFVFPLSIFPVQHECNKVSILQLERGIVNENR